MPEFSSFRICTARKLASSLDRVPDAGGVYAVLVANADEFLRPYGYFELEPRPLLTVDGRQVLYLGSTGRSLQKRLCEHLFGDSRLSTLRMTLGCLLLEEIGLTVLGTLGQTYFHFGDDEARLTNWMCEHLAIGFLETETPLDDEKALIGLTNPPLNIAGRKSHPFARALMDRRSDLSSRWIDSATGQIGGNLCGRHNPPLQPPRIA